MKKLKIIGIMLVFLLCSACAFVGCKGASREQSGIKVTYELCGGEYKNSKRAIVVYYRFPDSAKKLIRELPVEGAGKSTEKVSYAGYNFDGWYTEYSENGEEKTYSDKWDFDVNEVTADGITLYAKWLPKTEYFYEIGYMDGQEFVKVDSVQTYSSWKVGQSLEDIYSAANSREGYTFIKESNEDDFVNSIIERNESCFNENGEITSSNGDSVNIRVVVKYVKGNYFVVSSLKNLKEDIKANASKGKTILLTSDIDCGGEDLTGVFRNMFGKADASKLKYNGITSYDDDGSDKVYSISNFLINIKGKVGDTFVTASIFDKIPFPESAENGVSITNVAFDNVKINVDAGFSGIKNVYLSGLADTLDNVTIKNVRTNIEVDVDKSRNPNVTVSDAAYGYYQDSTGDVHCDEDSCKFEVKEKAN